MPVINYRSNVSFVCLIIIKYNLKTLKDASQKLDNNKQHQEMSVQTTERSQAGASVNAAESSKRPPSVVGFRYLCPRTRSHTDVQDHNYHKVTVCDCKR